MRSHGNFYRAALNAGRSSREKGVRLSVCLVVCPSNAWIVTKRKKNLSRQVFICLNPRSCNAAKHLS